MKVFPVLAALAVLVLVPAAAFAGGTNCLMTKQAGAQCPALAACCPGGDTADANCPPCDACPGTADSAQVVAATDQASDQAVPGGAVHASRPQGLAKQANPAAEAAACDGASCSWAD